MKKLFFYILVISVFAILSSCQVNSIFSCVKPEGKLITETYDIKDFTQIEMNIPGEVHLKQGENFSIKIVTTQNIFDLIELKQKNTLLEFKTAKNLCIDKDSLLQIYIECPVLEKFKLNGSGTVIAETGWNVKSLILVVAGSGNLFFKDITSEKSLSNVIEGSGGIKIEKIFCSTNENTISGSGELTVKEIYATEITNKIDGSGNITVKNLHKSDVLKSTLSGSGTIEISGDSEINSNEITIAGSGDINTIGIASKVVKIKVAGSGDVKVYAKQTLTARIAGSGDVYYKGDPAIDYTSSGSGELIKLKE